MLDDKDREVLAAISEFLTVGNEQGWPLDEDRVVAVLKAVESYKHAKSVGSVYVERARRFARSLADDLRFEQEGDLPDRPFNEGRHALATALCRYAYVLTAE